MIIAKYSQYLPFHEKQLFSANFLFFKLSYYCVIQFEYSGWRSSCPGSLSPECDQHHQGNLTDQQPQAENVKILNLPKLLLGSTQNKHDFQV